MSVRIFVLIFVLCNQVTSAEEPWESVVSTYCLDCHDNLSQRGGLDLENYLDAPFAETTDHWEQALRLIDARQMPPVGKPRPSDAEYQQAVESLTAQLDKAAKQSPNPGRTDSIRRLTRYEYKNAIRDLLDLEIDTSELLPADESSHGFDNITLSSLSPERLNRYLGAAQKVARKAIGSSTDIELKTYRLAPDLTQEDHVDGLPIGSRGGVLIDHHFPTTGTYEIRVFLARDRNESIEGMNGDHELHFLLNNDLKHQLELKRPKSMEEHTKYNDNLRVRLTIPAGPQKLGVTFPKKSGSLEENFRQPYQAHFNYHRHPRLTPAVFQVGISGPFDPSTEKRIETPSRRKIFSEMPSEKISETQAAESIVKKLMRQAYRRPVTESEVSRILSFYQSTRKLGSDFESGIESALTAILVSRNFLFRVESDPDSLAPGTRYALSNSELATRLSFFLWSSLPDEKLISAVETDQFDIEKQALRMLSDARSKSLVENFADQWLYLRNLDSITPDGRLFPGFDDNLRQAFKTETRMLFQEVIENDLSILTLLRPEKMYLNERLAKHYQIPHIYGPRFRAIPIEPNSNRGGLLKQGSILMVTSYATRTSPVIRGHWILENILGTPPPPPPPNIPSLDDVEISEDLPIRERLAKHREKAACASCHDVMDPIGFALENFDAIGQWRDEYKGQKIDTSGELALGGTVDGVSELEAKLLERPDRFARTLVEKLMTYGLGRGIKPADGPAIRTIVTNAKADNYRFSSLIREIVNSEPFRFRITDSLQK